MHSGLADVLKSLTLETVSTNDRQSVFIGTGTDDSGERIYGGQVMAQAVSAAQQTVEREFAMHSMHAYFLRQGALNVPVEYHVDILRNGRSFVTRTVVAKQFDKAIFTTTLSFQKPETGLEHATSMPVAPDPDTLVSEKERIDTYFADRDVSNAYGWPIDIRYVEPLEFTNPTVKSPRDLVWVKAADALPDDQNIHRQMLAYASDNPILTPAFNPHGLTPLDPNVIAATLNHTLWIHRPVNIDDWLLFDINSDVTSGGRGMGHAKIYNRSGALVASAMQEGLVRTKRD